MTRQASRRGVLVAHLTDFRLERCGWAPDVPVVLVARKGSADVVIAHTPAAARGGVAEGMTLTGARARLPQVRVERVDPVAEQEDLEALGRALERHAPVVRPLPPQALALVVDPEQLPEVRATLAGLGHACVLVHAAREDVALLLAAWGGADRMVPRGGERAALAPLSLRALALDPVLLQTLEAAGIRTLGQLAALPGTAVARRFGAAGRLAHARARGEPPRELPPLPMAEAPLASVSQEQDPPLETLDALRHGLATLLERAVAELVRTGQAACRLRVALHLEGGATWAIEAGLGHPTRDAARMLRVLALRLEGATLAAPVSRMEVEVPVRAPWQPTQPSLLDATEGRESFEELCARMDDLLGEGAPQGGGSSTWLPEGMGAPGAGDPDAEDDPAAPHAPVALPRPRPACILPEALAVQVEVATPHPAGTGDPSLAPPLRVRLEGRTLEVVACDGPERLEGGRAPIFEPSSTGAVRARPWGRDYWTVCLSDGRVAWLYRALPGVVDPLTSANPVGGASRWFLHGWWDAPPSSVLHPSRRRPPPRRGGAAPRYAELVAQSCFSFREGASTPEDLVTRAEALGLEALALVDRDGMYGSVRFHAAGKQLRAAGGRLRTLQGALLTLHDLPSSCAGQAHSPDGAYGSVAALATDLSGWSRLCRLVTRAHEGCEKGRGALPFAELLAANEGLVLLARGPWSDEALARLAEAAPGRVRRALSRQLRPGEDAWVAHEVARTRALGVGCVATNDVLAHDDAQFALQDVLASIRMGRPLAQMGRRLQPNRTRVLLSAQAMAARFSAWPELLGETLALAERCTFSLDELRYVYPHEVVPEGYTPMGWLRELCRRGAHARYGSEVPVKVAGQIAHELAIVERLGFASYFLTVHDLVRFARERGILCQGRGSAANSAVCFVLGVTSVDPAQQALLFERFLSEERGEPPDIDIDFEHERREEVLQYVYATYGRERAAMVNEVIRWRGRMAVRDVGKAVGLDPDPVEHLAAAMDHSGKAPPDDARVREAGLDPQDPVLRHVQAMVGAISGLPRHTSIHVGGFVISDGPLIDRAAVEPATMEGRTVLQWDKDDVDALGFVKVDLLSLGMLTAIRKAFDHVRATHGVDLGLATVSREDPAVYEMLCNADSTGVFQVESRAQQGMLPRLQPRCFYDLVVETAIVRPGPIQGGMVHPYLRRRTGEEAVTYVDPRLEPILARTLGVPIFQEQVMAMAVAVGGFSPGEADQLRRAMGAWRRKGSLGAIGENLMRGMQAQGIPEAYAQQIFAQIQGFAEYGFPESHAASFAHLVYVSAWLRCHYPAAFCAALLDSQPMGFYAPRSLVADAQRHGVGVLPVDVRASGWDCALERVPAGEAHDGVAIRLGLRMVRGLPETDAHALVAARGARPFQDLGDLARRAGTSRLGLRLLARAGALDGLWSEDATGQESRQVLWAVEGLGEGLFAGGLPEVGSEDVLPEESAVERLAEAYATVGLSVDAHPVGLAREALTREGVVPLGHLGMLPHDTEVEIAGLVAHRQRPSTAAGVVFLGMEDETGTANVVVWPKLYEAERALVRGQQLLRVRGVVQRQGAAVSVLARGFAPLHAPQVRARSRDFR